MIFCLATEWKQKIKLSIIKTSKKKISRKQFSRLNRYYWCYHFYYQTSVISEFKIACDCLRKRFREEESSKGSWNKKKNMYKKMRTLWIMRPQPWRLLPLIILTRIKLQVWGSVLLFFKNIYLQIYIYHIYTE